MVMFKIVVDDKKVSNYMRKLPGKLKANLSERADKEIQRFIHIAKSYAPNRSGKTRKGIIKGKAVGTKTLINRSVVWRELNKDRGRSFQKTTWKRFVNWMHNSPYSLTDFKWKTGYPVFFDLAEQETRRSTFKGMSKAVDKAIK